MDVSIIIVNWKSVAYLKKCLASIYENTHGLDCEVIVIDNASFDGCGKMIECQFPQVRFIQNEVNLGFAGASNHGFAQSSGRTLLFLNPDTEVIGKALSTLFAVLESVPDAGVIGAKLLNSDGTVQMSCIKRFPSILNQAIDVDILRNAFSKLRVWGTWPLLEKQQGPVAVDVVSGACMMLRRSMFENVGMFTTDYFMYSEDVDLCFKVRHAGFKNYYVDDAIVMHHGGASTSTNTQLYSSAVVMRESRMTFFALRYGRLHAIAYRISVVLVSLLRCTFLAAAVLLMSRRHNTRLRTVLFKWAAILGWALRISRQINGPARKVSV